MKNENRLSVALWLFSGLYFIYIIAYFLPRYYFGISDQQGVYYGARYFLSFPTHPIFALHYLRLGWVVDLPLVWLHVGFYGACVTFFVAYLLIVTLFYRAWFNERWGHWLLPLCLLVGLYSTAGSLNYLFDYYTVPIAFLLLALALYRFAMRANSTFLMLLAGLSFAVAAMGNVPLLPAFILAAFIGGYLLRHAKTKWFLLAFMLSVAVFVWLYYIHYGVWAKFAHGAITSYGGHPFSVMSFQLSLLGFFCLSLLGAFVIGIVIPMRRFFAFLAILTMLVINFGIFYIDISPVQYYPIMLGLFGFVSTVVLSEYGKRCPQPLCRYYLSIILLGFAFMVVERATSRMGPGCFFIYAPLVVFGLLLMLKEGGYLCFKNDSCSFWRIIFISLVTVLMTLATGLLHTFWIPQWSSHYAYQLKPISINNTYNAAWGVKMPAASNAVYQKMGDLYQVHHCKHKAFLALETMPMGFFMFHRLSPVNVVWISQIGIFPLQRKTRGEYLVAYLKKHPKWCVFWAHSGDEFTQVEKIIHRKRVLDYIKNKALYHTYLGDLSVDRSTKVWFYSR